MSRIRSILIALIVVITCLFGLQILLKDKFEEFLVNKMFEIPEGSVIPERLSSKERLLSYNNQTVQTFVVEGNPNSNKSLLIYPGLKGVYFYIDTIVHNQDLLSNYSKVITFNYHSQGKTQGVPNQDNINQLGKFIFDTYKTNNTILACLSNGAIPCSNLSLDESTKVKLIHPFLSAGCIIENVINNYYNYEKLSGIWLETKKTAEDVAKLEFLKNNKYLLNLLYFQPSQVNFLSINKEIKSNTQVYIATIDEYFSSIQYSKYFPNAIQTGAKSHTDIDPGVLLRILLE